MGCVADTERRASIVVEDGSESVPIDYANSRDVAHLHGKRLVGFKRRVAIDQHAEGDALRTRWNKYTSQRFCGEVRRRGRRAIHRRDVESDAAGRRRVIKTDHEIKTCGATVALAHLHVADPQAGRWNTVWGDRNIIDGKAVVTAGVIGIRPAQHDLGTGGNAQSGDSRRTRLLIGGGVAIQRNSRQADGRTGEVESSDDDTWTLELGQRAGNRWTAQQVRERNSLRGCDATISPLLAGVTHVERRDRAAGIVLQADTPEKAAGSRVR